MNRIERVLDRKVRSTVGEAHVGKFLELDFGGVEDVLALASRGINKYADDGWAGASMRDLKEWSQHGSEWLRSEMLSRLEEIQLPDDVVRPELTRRRRRVRGDFGNELDIHAVNQGHADTAWDKTVIKEVDNHGNKLVHIVVDLSTSAGVRFSDGHWRGAAVLRIYEALLRMGKSVAVSCYYSSAGLFSYGNSYARDGMVSCRLKDYGETLREDRLAAFSSIGFLRTGMFRATWACPGESPCGSLGYPISDYRLLTKAAEQDQVGGGAVVVVGQAFTKELAEKTVANFIRQFINRDDRPEGLTAAEATSVWRKNNG